jgi:hypothetical protein
MKNVYGALLASVSVISTAGALNAATLYKYTYTPGDLTTVITNPGDSDESSRDLQPPSPGLSFTLEFTTDGIDEAPFAGLELTLDGFGIVTTPGLPDVFLFSSGLWFDFMGSVTFDANQSIVAWSITAFDAGSGDGCGASGQTVDGTTTGIDFCNDNNLMEYSFGTTPGGWARSSGGGGLPGGGGGSPSNLGGGGGLSDPVPPSPVPLPASVLLLLSGIGALGAGGVWRRRRATV